MSAATANDSTDLEALFDSIVAANTNDVKQPAKPQLVHSAPAPAAAVGSADAVFKQIGHVTRKLHDTLRELGYDKLVERAASAIPDARERLAYVATMTEKAAERVLTATETARPMQEKLETGAMALSARWHKLFGGQLGVDQFRQLAVDTAAFIDEVPQTTRATNAQLTEVMMAQDFQDLTGQVIKKITDLVHNLEQELVKVLLENSPTERLTPATATLVNGPVVNGAGRNDVVTNQAQVDELLESLGF